MKIVACLTVSFLVFVAWAAGPRQFRRRWPQHLQRSTARSRPPPGETYDTLSTVNGQVRVGRGATANEAKTVNGQIMIEDDVKLGSASTVNGSLRIDDGVTIARQASTVNGGVTLGESFARGRRRLDASRAGSNSHGAEVAGKLITVNGDIELSDGSRVLGGIHIKKNDGTNWGWGESKHIPKCTSAPPAWSRVNCDSTGRSSCASIRARRSAR